MITKQKLSDQEKLEKENCKITHHAVLENILHRLCRDLKQEVLSPTWHSVFGQFLLPYSKVVSSNKW